MSPLVKKDCVTLRKDSDSAISMCPDISHKGPEIVYHVTKLEKRTGVPGGWISSDDNLRHPELYYECQVIELWLESVSLFHFEKERLQQICLTTDRIKQLGTFNQMIIIF